MHYIRLLRPPAVSTTRGRAASVALLLTITTDLGESFLYPDNPVDVAVWAKWTGSDGKVTQSCLTDGVNPTKCRWQAGMRVLKLDLRIPDGASDALKDDGVVSLRIIPMSNEYSSMGIDSVFLDDLGDTAKVEGLIMDVAVDLADSGKDDRHVVIRKMYLGREPRVGSLDETLYLEVEEGIGESIALHVWDAGVVAVSLLSRICNSPCKRAMARELASRLEKILLGDNELNVLELGCGIGILGLGLGTIFTSLLGFQAGRRNCTILLTDLPEAEERVKSNIARFKRKTRQQTTGIPTIVEYENLDWENGRKGAFPPTVRSRTWDLVMLSDCTYNVDMLPALVETLSALHDANVTRRSQSTTLPTYILLATKPRHASEKALFDIMANEGWAISAQEILPLPVIGREPETVEVYLFAKS